MTSTPLLPIFSRVSCASAGAAAARAMTRARVSVSIRLMKGLLWLVAEDLGQELLAALGFRGGEEAIRRPLLDHLPFVHENHPVRDAPGEAHLVGHAHHGHAVL